MTTLIEAKGSCPSAGEGTWCRPARSPRCWSRTLRRLVRRILRKHGYPPYKQEKATLTVLEQAEALSEWWTS